LDWRSAPTARARAMIPGSRPRHRRPSLLKKRAADEGWNRFGNQVGLVGNALATGVGTLGALLSRSPPLMGGDAISALQLLGFLRGARQAAERQKSLEDARQVWSASIYLIAIRMRGLSPDPANFFQGV
jgi:hypothetical protein